MTKQASLQREYLLILSKYDSMVTSGAYEDWNLINSFPQPRVRWEKKESKKNITNAQSQTMEMQQQIVPLVNQRVQK